MNFRWPHGYIRIWIWKLKHREHPRPHHPRFDVYKRENGTFSCKAVSHYSWIVNIHLNRNQSEGALKMYMFELFIFFLYVIEKHIFHF
jgi:hypothetical protein